MLYGSEQLREWKTKASEKVYERVMATQNRHKKSARKRRRNNNKHRCKHISHFVGASLVSVLRSLSVICLINHLRCSSKPFRRMWQRLRYEVFQLGFLLPHPSRLSLTFTAYTARHISNPLPFPLSRSLSSFFLSIKLSLTLSTEMILLHFLTAAFLFFIRLSLMASVRLRTTMSSPSSDACVINLHQF